MPVSLHHSAYDYGAGIGSVWETSLGVRSKIYGRLEGSETCDIVVIGAGITGLMSAYTLAKTYQAKVILIDAAGVGWGASGRGLGLCGPSPFGVYKRIIDANNSDVSVADLASADQLSLDLLGTLALEEKFDLRMAGSGILTVARSEAEMTALGTMSALIPKRDESSFAEFRSEQLREEWINSPYVIGGYMAQPAFGIDPFFLAQQLAQACDTLGVRIFGGTRVREIIERKGWVGVRYRGGTLAASHAIVATNAFSRGRAIPELADRMYHMLFHAIATRPLTEPELNSNGLKRPLILRAEDELTGPMTLRVLPDRRVAFTAVTTLDADPARASDVKFRMRAKFLSLLPGLRDVPITHSWRGIGARTESGLPFIGPLTDKGRLLYAGGLDYDSTNLATWMGKTVADVVAAPSSAENLPFVSKNKLSRIRFAGWKNRSLASKINKKTATAI